MLSNRLKTSIMRRFLVLGTTLSLTLFLLNCTPEDLRTDNPNISEENAIQDFIWEGMNYYYLWQDDVDDLADDRFATNEEYINFLNQKSNPDDFFDQLLYNYGTVDKWSWIVDDYIEQEKAFQGTTLDNGLNFGLFSKNSNEVTGYVRYISVNSDASSKYIKRGDLFTHVNGTKLTLDNYVSLLFGDNVTYTLSLAKMEVNDIIPTGVDVTLTKYEYTENPVFIVKTFDEDGHKVGYLMYNWFTRNFDEQLNDAFLQFKNAGVSELIVDLRYNPGGYVSSAIALSSMITGQFKGEVFSKKEWNSKRQAERNADDLIDTFTDKLSSRTLINSLRLSNVHFIVTGRSASASELVISSLMPYIDVSLVGTKTVGKYVASTTVYDSDNFSRNGVNPDHTYAIQPIIYRSLNAVGNNAKGGLEPQTVLSEDYGNLGVLGNRNEPLLDAAISNILGISAKASRLKSWNYETIGDSNMNSKVKNNMFVDRFQVSKNFKR